MRRNLLIYFFLLVGTFLIPWLIFSLDSVTISSRESVRQVKEAPGMASAIMPLPLQEELDPKKLALGEKLFMESRLSGDDSISCSTCHGLTTGGVDLKARSEGVNGFLTPFNTPTVFNVEYNFSLLWNGKFEKLEDQIDSLIQQSPILETSWVQVLEKLEQDSSYVEAFEDTYADGMTERNLKDALVTFQRSLATPNASFDHYLRGDQDALTEKEKDGYMKFRAYGCISCHQGVNIGGNIFQTFGVMKDYYTATPGTRDVPIEYFGRYHVTGNEEDKYVYRVPSLRNVYLTPPYFHDGSAESLEQAVRVMAEYQLGRLLSEEDVEAIVAFLKTLTGEYRGVNLASLLEDP